MKRILLKILVLITLFTLPLVNKTNSYYLDKEGVKSNTFAATTLDFSLQGDAISQGDVQPNETVSETLTVKKEGELGFNYQIAYANQ
jgi:hypothetical protein